MKVLVCGGREFKDYSLLNEVLLDIYNKKPITTIIEGGARGADMLAHAWGKANKIKVITFHADWNKHYKAAGPIRNQQMIDEGKPALVVAFPGGNGTADMVARAKKAGIKVIEV